MNDMWRRHDERGAGLRRPPGSRRIPRWALVGGVLLLSGTALLFLPRSRAGTWLTFLPFALFLACPLMMLFMMGSMSHGASANGHLSAHSHDVHQELDRLTRDEQGDGLRDELARLTARQEALRQDLERLEAERVPDAWNSSERTAGSR